ncbi:hypothetical protein FOA52_001728 [Chlamydomonas sp. UWO 241]|nr:hypothetical protein FOA52_001728 [Chlamydomonas sp. UWO 241]
MSVTVASAFNDLCSYALLLWLSTFYERTYHMDSSQYAPVMAVILPVGRIIGGVGGGWVADQVAKRAATEGRITRAWITGGTNAAAAPLMALTFSTHDSNVSFFALMAGYAMSEAWRAPSGNMARSCAQASMSATAVSLYLSIRCTIAGLGPLVVALLTQHLDGDITLMSVTVASAFNNLCSYALLLWLSTFYERTYHMDPSQYAPVMAAILIVGGGLSGAWAAGRITRVWITGGTNVAAAPLMALAFLTHDSNVSFFALTAGYAMSCAPALMSATAVSLYLSIRCIIGGLGPLGVALLTQHLDG